MNQKTYLLDSNIILRYLLKDHEEYSNKASSLFLRIDKEEVTAEIPAFIIVECVHVLSKFYEIPRTTITDKLIRLLNLNGIVNSDRSAIINALLHYQKTNIDFPDCLLTSLSSSEKKILSFDSDFKKLPAHLESL